MSIREWLRRYWAAYMAREGRREDAALSISTVVLAYSADSVLDHAILVVGMALLCQRLVADWER